MTEDERDLHLRAALRHAPDAQLQPPPALSALILGEARAKARDAAPAARPRRHGIAAWWDWLARPSVAAGFAGLMVATLAGVMWWDQPMDEALPRRPAPIAVPEAMTSSPPSVQLDQAAPKALKAPHAEAPATGAAADKAAHALAKPAAARVAPAAPPVEAKKKGELQAAREAAPPPAAAPSPEPAPPASVATALAAAEPSSPVRAAGVAKPRSADEAQRRRGAAVDTLTDSTASAAESNELRQPASAEARSTIAALRAAIAAEPARWTWQRGSEGAQGMGSAMDAWLAQLDAAAGTTWRPRTSRDTAAALGRELRLLYDGRVLHSLLLTERGVRWEHEQSAWQAELSSEALAALQAGLDSAAP